MALSTKQSRVIAALLASRNMTEAAQQAGVNVRTLHRYMTDGDFRQALEIARQEMVAHSLRRASAMLGDALSTFGDGLQSLAEPQNVKAGAEIFKAWKLLQDADVSAQLDQLRRDVDDLRQKIG